MSEPDLAYELGLFKQKMNKNKDLKNMKDLHKRATYTAKYMTYKSVESQ